MAPSGTPIVYGASMSAAKVESTMPGSGTPPSEGGQRSGQMKHGRDSSKVENLKDVPSQGAAH